MAHKDLINAWSKLWHPDKKLELIIVDDTELHVIEPITKNTILIITSKMKPKVLKQILELLGFVEKSHELLPSQSKTE